MRPTEGGSVFVSPPLVSQLAQGRCGPDLSRATYRDLREVLPAARHAYISYSLGRSLGLEFCRPDIQVLEIGIVNRSQLW